MTFNSLQYAAFLPLVVLLHWLLPKRFRLPLLLLASYVFYGAWDYRFLSLIWLSTAADFTIGLLLGRTEEEGRRKALLFASLAVNLGILGTFKYMGFFVDSATTFLERVGLQANVNVLEVVLPVGISFYTFQTLSYAFDLFRRRMEPCGNPILFATYVAFFPQLVAGPIERARRLLPRLQADRHAPSLEQVQSAVGLIVFGLVKKVVLADQMAPIVDRTFSSTATASGLEIVTALVAFSIQVYGDFSGYSDIARGSSRLLSVELMVNFRQPHLSRSITEFWRRWHISLSSWLRDYLYIPLGGNRGSRLATYRNLLITMSLMGLWHGAGWTYVVFGLFHGILLAIHRGFGGIDRTDDDHVSIADVWKIAGTFTLVALSWILFRSISIADAATMTEGLLTWRGPNVISPEVEQVVVWLFAMIAIDLVHRSMVGASVNVFVRRPVLGGVLAGAGLTLVTLFSGSASVPFIYFQF